jgi:hypothetical protein
MRHLPQILLAVLFTWTSLVKASEFPNAMN